MCCFAVTGAMVRYCWGDNRLFIHRVREMTADMDLCLCMISVDASFIKSEAELAQGAVSGVQLRGDPSDHDAGAGRQGQGADGPKNRAKMVTASPSFPAPEG